MSHKSPSKLIQNNPYLCLIDLHERAGVEAGLVLMVASETQRYLFGKQLPHGGCPLLLQVKRFINKWAKTS